MACRHAGHDCISAFVARPMPVNQPSLSCQGRRGTVSGGILPAARHGSRHCRPSRRSGTCAACRPVRRRREHIPSCTCARARGRACRDDQAGVVASGGIRRGRRRGSRRSAPGRNWRRSAAVRRARRRQGRIRACRCGPRARCGIGRDERCRSRGCGPRRHWGRSGGVRLARRRRAHTPWCRRQAAAAKVRRHGRETSRPCRRRGAEEDSGRCRDDARGWR